MTSQSIFRLASPGGSCLAAFAFIGRMTAPRALAADTAGGRSLAPSDRLLLPSHRSCPTCRKISAYIEESVKQVCPQMKDKSVRMVMIDFQDPKNGNTRRPTRSKGRRWS